MIRSRVSERRRAGGASVIVPTDSFLRRAIRSARLLVARLPIALLPITLLPIALLPIVLTNVSIAAGGGTVVIEEMRVGIDGTYKLGQWTPIQVRVRAGSADYRGRLTVQVPDPNGVAAQFVGQDFQLEKSQSDIYTTYVRFGQRSCDVDIILESPTGDRTTRRFYSSQFPAAISSDHRLVIGVGAELGLGRASALRRVAKFEKLVDHHVEDVADLPRHWLGYSSVDAIMLTTSDETGLANIDAAQWAALRQWVELGGTVITCGAVRAESLFGDGAPLAWLVPGDFEGVVNQRRTSGIEQFTEATRRLDEIGARGISFAVPMAVVRNPRGDVEATEGFGAQQSAAVIHGAAGLGRVVFVAFDLDQSPFLQWPDRPRLLAKLLDLALHEDGAENSSRSGPGPVAHVGFSDIVGQLRHALDQFSGVRLVPFSWIAGLIGLYIVIVGPLDYLLLRRWGRLEWTWLTFVLSVLVFTGLTFFLARHWKGTDFRCNKVTLVDIDLPSGTVRGTTWAHLFSPRTRQVSLRTQPKLALQWTSPCQQVTGWQGLPGTGFGGLDRRDRTESFQQPYQVRLNLRSPAGADARIERFPIAVWSSQSLVGQWWGQASLASESTRLTAGVDASVSGVIGNPLPVDLQNTYLIYDRRAIRLGRLASGAEVQIDDATGVDLQTYLTDRKVIKGRNVVTPWDPQNTDVDRVMQLLLFYGSAKGRAYTRLRHGYQRTIDWSKHLTTRQAVLWGRSVQDADHLLVDDQPVAKTDSWTYYRLLIPVALTGRRVEP